MIRCAFCRHALTRELTPVETGFEFVHADGVEAIPAGRWHRGERTIGRERELVTMVRSDELIGGVGNFWMSVGCCGNGEERGTHQCAGPLLRHVDEAITFHGHDAQRDPEALGSAVIELLDLVG